MSVNFFATAIKNINLVLFILEVNSIKSPEILADRSSYTYRWVQHKIIKIIFYLGLIIINQLKLDLLSDKYADNERIIRLECCMQILIA